MAYTLLPNDRHVLVFPLPASLSCKTRCLQFCTDLFSHISPCVRSFLHPQTIFFNLNIKTLYLTGSEAPPRSVQPFYVVCSACICSDALTFTISVPWGIRGTLRLTHIGGHSLLRPSRAHPFFPAPFPAPSSQKGLRNFSPSPSFRSEQANKLEPPCSQFLQQLAVLLPRSGKS